MVWLYGTTKVSMPRCMPHKPGSLAGMHGPAPQHGSMALHGPMPRGLLSGGCAAAW